MNISTVKNEYEGGEAAIFDKIAATKCKERKNVVVVLRMSEDHLQCLHHAAGRGLASRTEEHKIVSAWADQRNEADSVMDGITGSH